MRAARMKRLVIMLLAFSLLCCPVFADAEEEPCEHFRAWAEWNEEITVEMLNGEAHRVTAVCPDCGTPVSFDEAHEYFYASDAEAYDAEQHRTLKTCATCGYAVYEYADHEWQFGEWQSDDGELYYRSAVCTVCGAGNPALDFYEVEQTQEQDTDMPEETTAPLPLTEQQPEPAENFPTAFPVEIISVTVPDNLPLTATGNGEVYAIDNLSIVNHSIRAVKVKSLSVEAFGDWTLMPYAGSTATDGAAEKSIGLYVNGAFTTGFGTWETLYLPGSWSIASGAALPLCYDATVSYADIPHEGEQVLTLYFVLDWA